MNKQKLADALSRWLDVLNYWDSDVAECAERGSGMNWYHKYEKTQDEMYNLWKQLEKEVKNETQI